MFIYLLSHKYLDLYKNCFFFFSKSNTSLLGLIRYIKISNKITFLYYQSPSVKELEKNHKYLIVKCPANQIYTVMTTFISFTLLYINSSLKLKLKRGNTHYQHPNENAENNKICKTVGLNKYFNPKKTLSFHLFATFQLSFELTDVSLTCNIFVIFIFPDCRIQYFYFP